MAGLGMHRSFSWLMWALRTRHCRKPLPSWRMSRHVTQAAADHVPAQLMLGELLLKGEGVKRALSADAVAN